MNKHNELALDQPGSADAATVRWNALILSLVAALGIAAAMFADRPLVVSPQFDGAYAAIAFLLQAMTAWALFGHFRFRRLPSYLLLAAAYLLAALWGLFLLLAPTGTEAAAGLVWTARWRADTGHLLFAAAVAWSLRVHARGDAPVSGRRVPWLMGGTVLLATGLAVLLNGPWGLGDPLGAAAGRADGWPAVAAGGTAAAATLVALVLAWRLARRQTILHRWLVVALTARFAEVAIGIGVYPDYSVGWYMQRGEGLLAAGVLAFVLLGELNNLHRRVAATLASLSRANEALADAVAEKDRLLAGQRRDGEALRRSEERYRRLVSTAREGIWEVDAAFCTTYANRALTRLLGYSLDEMMGAPVQQFLFPEDLERFRTRADERHRGTEGLYELRLRRKNGSERWCTVSATPLFDDGGRFAGSMALITDITARKAAARKLDEYRAHLEEMVAARTAELAATESMFRGLVEQSLAGIYIFQDGYVRYANPVFAQVLGYDSPEEIIDRLPLEAIVAPEHRAMVEENIRLRTEGAVREMRYAFTALTRDGRRREVEVHGRALEYRGRPAVIGLALDVTERKQAEDKLRQAATVFTSTQEGVAITDLDGRMLAVNPAFTTITGYTEAEVLGESMGLLRSGRHDRVFYQNMWTALQATGSWHGEVWNRRKSGDIYLQWLSVSTVRDEQGAPTNYVAIFTDITRIHHAETQFEYLAHHDALTGLPNRLLLSSRLEQALERARRYETPGAVLFIDLDGFKPVNDRLGHAAGDELLQLVSGRLSDRLRETDTLARIGGDEFVAVLEEVTGRDGAAWVAGELIEQLHQPFELSDDGEVSIGGSIGIALFPEDGESVPLLIDRADKALYRAKRAGKGVYRFYRESAI